MKTSIIFILTLYKKLLSPFFEAIFGHACRFEITCCEYTLSAVKKHGAIKGLYLGTVRLSRCHI